MAKPALGRGLGALLGGNPVAKAPVSSPPKPVEAPRTTVVAPLPPAQPGTEVRRVSISEVRPCPFQPRKAFSPEALSELADSIREQGIVQPLVVRERDGYFELIAGERRWRAAQLAGLSTVPVVTREADDATVLELALIENLQRENLNPMEESQGYAQLIEQFSLTQEQAAAKVGKSRAVVANALRLLKLPPPVQTMLREGALSVGHAKVILGLAGSDAQKSAADKVVSQGLNVRQTEALLAELSSFPPAAGGEALPKKPEAARDVHVIALENRLRERLGTKVRLRYAKGKGAVEISFFSDDELDRILGILGVSPE